MPNQNKCPNCGATKPDISLFRPMPDMGGKPELDCKECNRSYEYTRGTWVPR